MIWIAPSQKVTATAVSEKRFWDAAEQFRANSVLKIPRILRTSQKGEPDLRTSRAAVRWHSQAPTLNPIPSPDARPAAVGGAWIKK